MEKFLMTLKTIDVLIYHMGRYSVPNFFASEMFVVLKIRALCRYLNLIDGGYIEHEHESFRISTVIRQLNQSVN